MRRVATRGTHRLRGSGTPEPAGSRGKDPISRDQAASAAWLDEWVHGLDGRAAYLEKLGADRIASLRPGPAPSGQVDYGAYR